ncbi:LysR family transcriptional regulator [Poseidonocella sp. HB161398]|uniref:LysR family transcriptional regulator n=1 Tax=Poseidonocella sp. HB161398 TaxID=2320855 RepID=UPI0011081760|nr:LysR family transcriptional regulator [Poseidonocella sp. HB161398]
MDIRFLESFVTVAECGSIAEAARRLNLTPAALAQRLQKLEQILGRPLVVRAGRTVRPTASGLAILPHARSLIESARDLSSIAANDEPAGRLLIGATASALTGLLPEIVGKLRGLYPGIEYFVQPGASIPLYHEVASGKIDAALIVQPQFAMPKSTGWMAIRQEPLLLIAPEGVALDNPHEVITSHPFIRYDRSQWGGSIVDRYLRQNQLKVKEWLELDALDAIASLVSRRLGVAVVPDWAPPWPEGLKLGKRVLPDGGYRQIGVLWNRSGPRSLAVQAFVDACATMRDDAARIGTPEMFLE